MNAKAIKYMRLPLALLSSLHLGIFPCQSQTVSPTVDTSYHKSYENFPNPERGFFTPSNPTTTNQPLKLEDLQKVRANNRSLVRRTYLLAEFRTKPLSSAFLQMVSNDFQVARQAGVKLIIKFTYNWIGGGADAPRDTILYHLEQLQPVLANNSDVIAYMHAGFIGYWGEWNRSTNNLLNLNDIRAITFKILSVLPPERMVALRYPKHKVEIYNNSSSLDRQQAFSQSYRARTGAINECFLASSDDWGTYKDTDPEVIESEKRFLNIDNQYVVQGGETCNADSEAQPYITCDNAIKDLARMHWSDLNAEFEPDVIKLWEKQKCLPKIQRLLGYRFRLANSVISSQIKPGSEFSINLKIANDGWASPYNPRLVEVILRHSQTGAEYYLPVQADPRKWMSKTLTTLNIVGGIPNNIPPGTYDVLLNLPDPAPKLYNRPEYSIRLANKNTWEATTGYNYLLRGVTVDPNATANDYTGQQFFQLR